MNPRIPKSLAACALILNACAFVVFVIWISKLRIASNPGDYGFHVTHRGPPAWLIAALALSILGVMATCACLVALMLSGPAGHQPRSHRRRALTSLAALGVAAPAVIIVPGSVWLLPAAQKEARLESAREAPSRAQLKALTDENYAVRRDAAISLATASWLPESAIPKLMKAAARNDGEPSSFAILALGHFRDRASEVVPGLVDLLEKPEIGPAAGEVLGRFGKPGMDALMRASTSENAQVRASAAHGLGRTTHFEEAVIARLMELLHDEDGSVRAMSAMSLGIWGIKSESALQELNAMANDPDPDVRREAQIAANAIASRVGPRN